MQRGIYLIFVWMKLVAYDIVNLTDARYFAARGAHLIGFSAISSTVEEVNAIKSWVDVPDFFIQLPDNADADFIWEWQERTGINKFLVSNINSDLIPLFPKAKWIKFLCDVDETELIDLSAIFIQMENMDKMSSIEVDDDTDQFIELSSSVIDKLDKMKPISGVFIQGGAEDKIGLKSYEVIDELLDRIEVEY